MSASDTLRPLARRTLLRASATTALLATAGCNDFIPSSGPRIEGIMRPATEQGGDPGTLSEPSLRYALLTLDPGVIAGLGGEQPNILFSAGLQSRSAAEVRFGTGDILAVTIFETQAGGLFIPPDAGTRPGNFVTLPQQQ